jgi:anti-sigma regulatory factor (Ser/Thr protein kinase)
MTSSGDVRALAYGGACLWRFGGDAACAKQARDALGAAMREMGFDADAIDSGRLAVSELATNGHQHASRLAVSADAAAVEL